MTDETANMMKRCFELVKQGAGSVSPNPLRIVLGECEFGGKDYSVFEETSAMTIWLSVGDEAEIPAVEVSKSIKKLSFQANEEFIPINQVLKTLGEMSIISVLVEFGAKVFNQFI